jgi:hypothetical protein
MKVEAGSLQWDRSLGCKDVIHAYAVIGDARQSEIAFVYLLASHSRILSHLDFSQVFGWIADIQSNGRPPNDRFRTKLSSLSFAVPVELAPSGRLRVHFQPLQRQMSALPDGVDRPTRYDKLIAS